MVGSKKGGRAGPWRDPRTGPADYGIAAASVAPAAAARAPMYRILESSGRDLIDGVERSKPNPFCISLMGLGGAAALAMTLLLPPSASAAGQLMSNDADNAQLPAALENLGPGRSNVYAANVGVVCDGTTNITKPLQNAVDLAEQLAFPGHRLGGGRLVLPAGFCMLSGAINITSGITIEGAGTGSAPGYGNSGGTVIRTTSSTADVFAVTSDGAVVFTNFVIDASGAAKASGAGISINGGSASTANIGSRITGVVIRDMHNAVSLGNAFGWKIRDNIFQDYQNDGVLLTTSETFPDGSIGGSLLDGNTIFDLNVGSSYACVEIQGGGDVIVSKDKLLGSQFGVLLNVKFGPTGTLLIVNNSLEEQKIADIALTQSVSGMEYGNVVINGNELLEKTTPTAGNIYIGTGTPSTAQRWLRHVVISSNVIGDEAGTSVPGGMIQINDGTDIVLSSNVLSADGNPQTIGISLGASAANVKISSSNIAGDMPAGLGVAAR